MQRVFICITLLGFATSLHADVFTNLRKRPCAVLGTCNLQPPTEAARSALDNANHAVGDILTTAAKAIHDVEATREKAIKDAATTTAKALRDADATLAKAKGDIDTTAQRAVYDIGKTGEKAFRDVGDAGAAVGRYANRQWLSEINSIGTQATRFREGRTVDSLWQLSMSPLKNTNDNAGKAVKESSLLNTVGAIAASAYGGPGGAAAYAAWYTYQVTGDQNLALRVGVLTGATSLALGGSEKMGIGGVAGMPSKTTEQLEKKIILAGAVGGLAVAASGGDKQAVQEGFLKAGGMIFVQDRYRAYTEHDFDARSASRDGVCINSGPHSGCSPPEKWYEHDAQGNRLKDANGDYKLAWKEVDPRVSHVGTWAKETDKGGTYWKSERSPVMNFVGRVPGMNAMALFHDKWTVGWTNGMAIQGTIVPAVMLTYIGTGDALYGDLQKTSVSSADSKHPASLRTSVAASQPVAHADQTASKRVLDSVTCVKADDSRTIFVAFKNSDNGAKSCEVVDERKLEVLRPWHARTDFKYCEDRAKDLVTTLRTSSYACLTN